jgi:hypothetical protein
MTRSSVYTRLELRNLGKEGEPFLVTLISSEDRNKGRSTKSLGSVSIQFVRRDGEYGTRRGSACHLNIGL